MDEYDGFFGEEKEFDLNDSHIDKVMDTEFKRAKMFGIFVIAAVIVIVGITFIFLAMKHATKTVQEQVSGTIPVIKIETVEDYVELDISYEDIINNIARYDGKWIEVTGFLFSKFVGEGTDGYYEEYVTDYFGNRFKLEDLTPQQKAMFEKGKRSEGHYNVTGIVQRSYRTPIIHVKNIYVSFRPVLVEQHTIQHEENVTMTRVIETTVPRYPWLN